MNKIQWEKSHAKKLFDCFMEIEKSQYFEFAHARLDKRKNTVEKFILEFGVNHVTIQNYTNMMQISSSIMIDVFDSERLDEGSIVIHIGSEPQELWAHRESSPNIMFNFEKWVWVENPGE